MFRIVQKQVIAQDIKRIDIAAPEVAAKISPGQFVMLTAGAKTHPIPLTVVDADAGRGVVSFIVHEVGAATRTLGGLSIGQAVSMIVGPLGRPAAVEKHGLVICAATGIGAAQILPICRALKKKGNKVIGIIGAKSKKVLMLEAQMRVVCDQFFIATNDGSYERKGLATQILQELLDKYKVDAVYAIGSVDMMEAASRMAIQKSIPVRVTLSPYMATGMGICGSCRVKVNGQIQLACCDGPEFNGYEVDFEDLRQRENATKEKAWDRQNRLASQPRGGLKIFKKSFWGLEKNKV